MTSSVQMGTVTRNPLALLYSLLTVMLLAGCSATTEYQTRPFFQTEQNVEHHGRKSWFDHLVEVDPGRAGVQLAADYDRNPPERIAVLPFVDLGSPSTSWTKFR
jgi:hypothetical protein